VSAGSGDRSHDGSRDGSTRTFAGRFGAKVRHLSGRSGIGLVVLLLSGCAARAPMRPSGTPAADPTAAQAFAAATRDCATVSSMTAEIGLSGRALGERVRGRLIAGFATPASVRLEAVAPFGPPVFVLAARDDQGTILFPREHRVLMDTNVADILARLTGLDLGAGELRLLLTGCLVERAEAAEGRTWPGGWRAVTLGPQRTAYLRDVAGRPLVMAADYGSWQVDYADHLNGWPRTVRVRRAASAKASASQGPADTDITAKLQQLEINVPLDARAFDLDVPADAQRVTLDDLRSVAPLRDKPR
jgi:outer membrane biogenesis lipoprotein LolB